MTQDPQSDDQPAFPEAAELDVDAAPAQQPDGLVAIAKAIEAAKGDLAGTVERLAQDMGEKERSELVGEMMSLEEQNPGAFLAGALAGFALGRSTAAPQTAEASTAPGGGAPEQEPAEAGVVVSAPADMVQVGPGGPGYLEPPTHADEKE